MMRFFAIFAVTLILSTVMMSGLLSRYGYSLIDPEVRIMLGVCVLVAGYVAWRISNVLKARSQKLAEMPAPGGAGQGKLAALFAPRSKALSARQADLEARRRRLIAEGKLDAEEAPAPELSAEPPRDASPASAGIKSVRVAADAPLKDKMAARAERVRRAKEEGKI
ncbi:hypothetical protein [Hyphomonas sp.]|uniref:hypothetical protein n=1 Tax=Hyphomonas sp. TaxID=87 RepID=UPI00391CC3C8